MSIWNSFTSAISTLGAVGKTLTGGGSFLNEDEQKREEAFMNKVRENLDMIERNTPKFAKERIKVTADALLYGATKFNDYIYSPLTRTVSTAALLTDTNSPLYKKGQFEEGFQFQDIKSAYNRSAKVTALQALTKSNLIPLVNPLSQAVLSTGKINLDEVDLWNDESVQKNFKDNGVGRWFTGIGDAVLGGVVLGVAGKAAGIAAKTAAKPAGLYTKNKTVDELAADMDTGILYAKTNGFEGTQTVSGSHAVLLAGTKDWGVVEDIVTKYSTNEKLIPLIREASDADAVKDLLLADKGNTPALERLAATASDKLFDMADVKTQIQNKIIQSGELYLPEGPAVSRLQKVFDDAINSDPQFKRIKEAFFDENYKLTTGDNLFRPLEPIVGAKALIKAQEKILGAKTTIRSREYGAISGFLETTIGETAGGLVMRGVRLAGRGTENKPTGFVSFSGARPMQARTELKNFLDSLKMLRDGSKKIVVGFDENGKILESVSSVRARLEDQYMRTLGMESIEQVNALKAIDAQIGNMLAYKANIFDKNEIDAYVAKFQMNVSKGMQSAKENGFGIGYDGNVTLVDPQTVRQLAETYRFTPWDKIERQLDIDASKGISKAGQITSRTGRDVFEQLNRVWTFDVLARPSYAFKQSLFEPILSATLSQGIGFTRDAIFKDGISFASKNFKNWSGGIIKRYVTNKSEYKAVVADVKDRSQALELAVAIKNSAQTTVEELLAVGSPAMKTQHLTAARKELKAAENLLDNIELELRDAIVPYGIKEAIPSMATLERRIAYLESKPGITAKTAEIEEAKVAIANYKNTVSKLATNKKVIVDAENAVQKAYDKIDVAVKELGEARVKQADVFGKSAEFKKRYYSKEKHVAVVDGEQYHIDSFIQEQSAGSTNYFTAAIREETKNGRTQQINFLGELASGQTLSSIKRKQLLAKVKVTDEVYFEELADIANRQFRGDPLIDLILGENPMEELLRWAKTDTGSAYLRNPAFNIHSADEIPSYLADKVSLVKRMYPSYEARAAILKGEVTSQQLETLLASYTDKLYDIVASNHNYEILTFGMSNFAKATDNLNKLSTKIFSTLASVENPIRGAVFDKMATTNVAKQAAYLKSQGVDMTIAQYNALRRTAERQALIDMEKVFYTINNPNKFVHALRAVTAFPAAGVNSLQRYLRFAKNNPTRTAQFVSGYGRAFETFGVDENGNPTDDIDNITHFVIPASKDLGWGPQGQGIKIGSQSLGFFINRPGPSFLSSYSTGQLMQNFHKSEAVVEDLMTFTMPGDDKPTNWYKVIFPYGPATSVRDVYTPPWLKNATNSFQLNPFQKKMVELVFGKGTQKDYLSSWKSVFNYNAMLVENGVIDKMPSDADMEKQVRSLFRQKFVSTFASPYAGIPFKVEGTPMALTSRLYFKLIEKNKAEGMSNQEARDAAGDEMIRMLGPNFMVDRVSFTGSQKNLNMPATSEAYARVFEDNIELVKQLAEIEPGEIGLVGLLTADLEYNPAKQSSNILTLLANPNAVLPGTSKNLNEFKMTPQEIETERLKQRTWDQYMTVKAALEAKITDGRTLRAHPEFKAVLDNLAVSVFREQSQAWYDQYQLAQSGDTSYKYARALTLVVNNEKWMAAHGDSQYWKDAKEFLKARTLFVQIYQMLPDYDPRKAKLSDNYNAWIQANVGQWDGAFKTLVTRYFDNDSLKAVN
jgi:hypothetical protein